ncbi:hypothetical protein K2173_012996 [Erythroxylum novogranatense]|uniref:Uncharacterized protein n=1 Tax=Erythroxylum novogranatense TaxID=1862640 RepID=A0AAV8S628_9ROSI|nr:hypothetical protein K2173_012996 [Erythroxylum novogranatense]
MNSSAWYNLGLLYKDEGAVMYRSSRVSWSVVESCVCDRKNVGLKTKRTPKVEAGTATKDASLDEWLQDAAYTQSESKKSKKKKN